MPRPTSPIRGRRGLAFLIVVALAGIIAACGAGAALAPLGSSGGTSAERDLAFGGDLKPAPVAPEQPTSADNGGPPLYALDRPDLLIIKTGTMSLEVAKIDDALADASAKITALGGYVAGSSRRGDGDEQVASVTYRIPAAQWDAALVALRALGQKVLAEQTQTQDVTGDVIDLGARITNLQATEAALQGIMARATKIADVLAVQEQLTDVRGQIEQLQAEKKHLEEQAAFSTLSVDYSLKPQAAVVTSQQQFDPTSEVDQAAATLVDVLQAVATAGIWFAIVWLPILLVLGVLGGIVFLIVRRARRNRRGPDSMLPVTTPSPSDG
jgi:hypothetical protein